jgi:hypothetical protein
MLPMMRRVAIALSMLAGLSQVPPASAQTPSSRTLFEAAPQRAPASAEADRGTTTRIVHRRSRQMRARVQALGLDAAAADAPLVLNLFTDVSPRARRTALERHPDGSYTWQGRIDGDPDGHVTLVANGAVMVGTIFTRGRTYEVSYAGGGVNDIRELDPASFPTDDPEVPDAPGQAYADQIVGTPVGDAASQIDVMVVWTPAARTAVGGTTAMQNLVNLAVANANTAYANSQITTRLRLVHSQEVSFTENAANISADLTKLSTTNDGSLEDVHTLREQYKADLVSLIGTGYASGSGACGIGYLMTSVSTSFASAAFNVVDQLCAAGNLSLAHELGHNQGLHHDPANASGQGAYPYAYGYQEPGGHFRTVMSYGTATRIMNFSNPGIAYSGYATGVANAEDNARALNNTAATVANFKLAEPAACTYSLNRSSISFPSGGGTSSVGVTTGSGCAWTVTNPSTWVSVGAGGGTGSGSITVSAGANGPASRSATLTVAGKSVAVTQSALACTYSVSPGTLTWTSAGGTASFTVSTAAGCGWSAATTGSAWIGLGTSSGSGTASVVVTVPANTGPSRSATISVGGKTLQATQASAPGPSAPANFRIVQ